MLHHVELPKPTLNHKKNKSKHLTTKSQRRNIPTPPFDYGEELLEGATPRNTKTLSKNVFDSLRSQRKSTPKQSHTSDAYLDDHHFASDEDYDDDQDDDDSDTEKYDPELDPEDEGTIHPFGPNIDPKVLLNTLTNTDRQGHNPDHPDLISQFNQSPFPTVTRNNPGAKDGRISDGASIPGPPRDLQAQIVNPRFVALSWMEPAINPDEVISYTVYYKMTTSER